MTVLEQAVEWLQQGLSFAYATIITQNGSAPRSAGAKMLITAEETYGTIGGGAVEGDIIAIARQTVLVTHEPIIKYYNLSGEDAANADLICGGDQEILLDYMDAHEANHLMIFQQAVQASLSGQKAWLVTAIDATGKARHHRQFCLAVHKGALIGQFVDDHFFTRAMAQTPLQVNLHDQLGPQRRFVVDPIHTNGKAYIFGAGHVSQEVAKITNMVDFRTMVIDDRAEFANQKRFPQCQVQVINSFEQMPQWDIDQDSYILIITRGHMYDRVVLQWALTTNPGYIGMIGSLSKRDKIYDILRSQGISQERLEAVHSPIGLKIGSETPAEIAVSIVSELIQVRAKQNKTP